MTVAVQAAPAVETASNRDQAADAGSKHHHRGGEARRTGKKARAITTGSVVVAVVSIIVALTVVHRASKVGVGVWVGPAEAFEVPSTCICRLQCVCVCLAACTWTMANTHLLCLHLLLWAEL